METETLDKIETAVCANCPFNAECMCTGTCLDDTRFDEMVEQVVRYACEY